MFQKPALRQASLHALKKIIREEVLFDAIVVWLEDARAIINPEDARLSWRIRSPEKATDTSDPRNHLEYWQEAQDVLLDTIKTSSPGERPFFRGQSVRSANPLDRARSWSRNIETGFDFSKGKPRITGPNGSRDVKPVRRIIADIESGERVLAKGESLSISIFFLDRADSGLDIQKELGSRPKEAIIEKIENGEDPLCELREGGKWIMKKFSPTRKKIIIAEAAINHLGKERVADILGIDRASSVDTIIRKASRANSHMIEKIIEETPSQDLIGFWQESKSDLLKKVRDLDQVGLTDFCLSEEEVIIQPSKILKPKRINVVIARSDQDLVGKSIKDVKDMVVAAISESLENIKDADEVTELDITV